MSGRAHADACLTRPGRRRSAALLAAAALPANPARAAGRHHAVGAAAMLGPAQCQFETWIGREHGGMRTLRRAGRACRLGAVERGLNAFER